MSLFQSAKELPASRRMTVGVSGEEGTGKSTFALSFPGRKALINFDRDPSPLISGREDVDYINIHCPNIMFDTAAAQVMMAQFDAAYNEALKGPYTTVVIDGGKQLWDVVMEAKAQESENKHHIYRYRVANEYMRSVFSRAEQANKNLVITMKAGDEYVGENKTGRKEAKGWGDTMSFVNVFVWMHEKRGQHVGEIKKCKYDTRLHDTSIPGLDFWKLYSLVFKEEYQDAGPGTD